MKTNPAALPAAPTAFSSTIDGTWFVKTRTGVLALSLDELDRRYQRGEVHAQSYVFTSGMAAWDRLGAIADLDGRAASDEAAPPPEAFCAGAHVITPEAMDDVTLPPMTNGVFGTDGPSWASIAAPDNEVHTVVRRSAAVVPYSIRQAAGTLADYAASLRLSHPRLAAAGPWLFGAALSGIFILSLYQIGVASTRPESGTNSGLSSAHAPNADARGVAARVTPASIGPAPAALRSKATTESAPLGERAPEAVTGLSPIELRLAPTRVEAKLARSARAKDKARASKSRSAKSKARAARKAAKRTGKRSPTALLD